MAVAVGEITGILQLAERRQRVLGGVLKRAPHPHGGWAVNRTQGEVLRHAFDEPERELGGGRQSAEIGGPATAGDVVLEGMHQLMADDVIQVAQRSSYRQDDPPPKCFGYTSGALPNIATDGIGLLEFRRAGIQNQGLAPR